MTFREKLANWLTRGAYADMKRRIINREILHAKREGALVKTNLERDRFEDALREISDIASGGRLPNGTVRRMGRIAADAIGRKMDRPNQKELPL